MADVQPLLVRCFAGCHQPLAQYATLISEHTQAECPGQQLVKPGDPDSSVIVEAMTGASCGEQMPPRGPYLGTDKIDLVRTWILQGAPNN
jgi:hypothetical protein